MRAKATARAPLLAAAMCLALWAGCDGTGFGPSTSGVGPGNGEDNYTILLGLFSGPDRVDLAKYYKRKTEEHAKWSGLFIVHEGRRSALYRGKYPNVQAAQADLKRARSYRTPARVRIFEKAVIAPLPGSDPGPKEWNLLGTKRAYTVTIAVFFDEPKANYYGRKNYAVMYCKQLREDKGLEAYYYHGPAKSHVTVGAFPASAIEIVKKNVGKTILIPHDPRIKEIMQRFPYMAVNGRKQLITVPVIRQQGKTHQGQAQRIYAPSTLNRIPKKKGSFGI